MLPELRARLQESHRQSRPGRNRHCPASIKGGSKPDAPELARKAATLTSNAPFQEESDIGFYQNGCRCQTLSFAPGDFAVFFPEDAHKPCCRSGAPACRKLIVKVALD